MQVLLSEIAKRYHRWIFRSVNYRFEGPGTFGVSGRNGSGKSTLLSIIAGYTTPTRGEVTYYDSDEQVIDKDNIFRVLSIAAPYVSLIGELTLAEHLTFHSKFKKFLPGIDPTDFFAICQLKGYEEVLVAHLSSGLQQRYKLALAILTSCDILLLDEPTSYLDVKTKGWFEEIFKQYSHDRLVILASNDKADLDLTDRRVLIEDYQV